MAAYDERRRDFTGAEIGATGLRQVGHTLLKQSRPGLGPHLHDKSYEVCYLRSGRMHWWAGDPENDYIVSAGEMTLTYPDEVHGGVDSIHEAGDLYWVSFELGSELVGLEDAQIARLHAALADLPRHFAAERTVCDYYEQILGVMADPGPFAQVRVRGALQLLLVSLIDYGQREDEPEHDPRMERVLERLHQRGHQPRNIDAMAAIAGLSPNRFINQFKAYTGYSPMDYLNREKLQRAKQLLGDPGRSITEIAFELDFSSTQYFATMFKKYTGMTPTQFRRESFA